MKDRAQVRQTRAPLGAQPAEWTVTRPRIGFAQPETFTATTAAAAWSWLRHAEKPRGGSAGCERSYRDQDGISPHPHWEPYPYRYPRRW